MFSRRTRLLTALAAGTLIGLGYPLVDLELACRDPVAEACVWGKAYLALTLGLSGVVVGGTVAGGVYAGLSVWGCRRSRRSRPGPPQHARQRQQNEPARSVSGPKRCP